MNRFYNALLLFLSIPTIFFAIYVGFDLPLAILNSSGAIYPHSEMIFIVIGLIMATINIRRSIRRWFGVRLVAKTKEFRWNEEVTKDRIKRIWTYNILEAVVMTAVAIGLYKLTPLAWMPSIALLYCAFDNVVFSIVGTAGKMFRVGMTSKAIVAADRDVTVIYFSGLRKIEKQQDSLYFEYIDDLELNFPLNCIDEHKKEDFYLQLRSLIDHDKVYVANNIPRATE